MQLNQVNYFAKKNSVMENPGMTKKEDFKNILFYLFSILLSCYIFFSNAQFFNWLVIEYQPVYLDYSKEIFHPGHMAKVMYWGESILLPLIAQVIGASQSKSTYFFLCGLISLAIIPAFSFLALRRLQSPLKATIFILLLVGSFPYLRQMDYSSPDFLTILLIGSAVLSQRYWILFIGILLATLSHFSITLVSVISLLPLLYFSPLLTSETRKKTVLYLMGGLLAGRGLLALWYWNFKYLHTGGRSDYALDLGVNFFAEKYLGNPSQFWLIPQISFLSLYLITILYFAYQKQYRFCIAAVFALSLAYAAMFFTVDGYRIFATIIAGAYGYLLLCLVNQLSSDPKPSCTNS